MAWWNISLKKPRRILDLSDPVVRAKNCSFSHNYRTHSIRLYFLGKNITWERY